MSPPTAEHVAEATEALAVLDRCNTASPSAEDIKALRHYLNTMPNLWKETGDLSLIMTSAVIDGINGPAGLKESLYVGRKAMRRELGHATSPLLEKMLIDHLILCWLRLQMAEHDYTACNKESVTLTKALFWEKRLAAVQRRYLRAVETLARIRKLALPTIQVNIGDKQINVAGG